MDEPDARHRIAAVAYLTFVTAGITADGLARSGPFLDWRHTAGLVAAAAVHAVTGYLIYRLPGHGVTRVLAAMGLLQGLGYYAAALAELPAGTGLDRVANALGNVAWTGGLPMLALLILVLPSGGPPSRRWRPVLAVQIACLVTIAAAGAAMAVELGGRWLPVVAGAAGGVLLVTAVSAAAAQVLRWRRADGAERAQLRVFALTSALVVAGYLLAGAAGSGAGLLVVQTGLPLAVAYAVLRHRLYGLDPVVSRVLVWAVLTVALLAVYLAVAALAAQALRPAPGLLGGLLPAAVVAVAFAALRQHAQRLVDRTLYGARGDPASAVRTLARRLARCSGPEEAPAAVAAAVTSTLRLPWAAVEVDEDGARVTAAQVGTPTRAGETLPLHHAGETVGWLRVGLRRGEAGLAAPDRRLLADLAAQAAPAIATARLIGQLAESRDRLVRDRQLERDRLRAELHDELSPTLTGIAVGAQTARQLLSTDPGTASDLLGRIADQATTSMTSVRQLLADLGPAPVPGPDLLTAIEQRCRDITRVTGLAVTVRAELPPHLPERTEVAAYRIVTEALTNVVRHAQARRCTVHVVTDADLRLTVTDDGVGLNGHPEGVGLTSMRARAREAGGRIEITSRPGRTCVEARLPLERP